VLRFPIARLLISTGRLRRTERIAVIADEVRTNAPVDEAVAATIGTDDPDRAKEIVRMLECLASLLRTGP
jgi:hypothetical protein